MTLNLNKHLRMAAEELEEQEAAAVVEPTVDEAEVPEELGETVDVIEAEGDEHAEVGEQIDGAVADVNDLDTISDTVAARAEGDDAEGLTPTEAEVVEVAVESLYRRLNMRKSPKLAAESFGAARTRKDATRLAAESISEGVANAWKTIKEFIKRAWEAVKAFFVRVFTETGRIKAHAQKIVERAKVATGAPSAKEIPAGGFAARLEMGGQFGGGSVAKNNEVFTAIYTGLMDGYIQTAADAQVAMEAVAKGEADTKILNMGGLKTLAKNKRAKEQVAYLTGEFPGNKAFSITLPAKGGTLDKVTFGLFTQIKFSMDTFDPKRQFKAENVAIASPEQSAEIAESVIKMCDEIDAQKKTKSNIDKMMAEALKFADEAERAAGSKEKQANAATIKSGISRLGTLLSSMPSQMTGYALGTAKASLDYAGKSVAKFGAPKAEAKA